MRRQAPTSLPVETDLLVIGGPTEGHGMTEPVTRFFDPLAPGALRGTAAAGFDNRLRWPRWLSGSAPGLVTTGLLAFIAAWNEFLYALTFTQDFQARTRLGRG